MDQRIAPPRKFARRIFLLLPVLAAAVAAGIWWLAQKVGQGDGAPPPRRPVARSLFVEIGPIDRPLMGTNARILVHALDEEGGRRAIEAAFARGREIDEICTDYDPESELMQLSDAPLNTPVKVSPTLAAVLAHAQSTAEITDGAFDPTFGPLTRLWRLARREKTLPDPETLARARQAASWKNLEVDLTGQFVILKEEAMRLDLGGIAKGFAADEMMAVLLNHGIRIAYIAIAGDIRLGAPPPGRRGWGVELRTLGLEPKERIEVSNCAVSTSGDLYQFVEIDGVRYSHIIDPATGLGLTRRIAATVVAPTAVQSDPLATFCCIDPERALRLLAAGEISCRIVMAEEGRIFEEATRTFPPVDALP